jgi:hypothetical protein
MKKGFGRLLAATSMAFAVMACDGGGRATRDSDLRRVIAQGDSTECRWRSTNPRVIVCAVYEGGRITRSDTSGVGEG